MEGPAMPTLPWITPDPAPPGAATLIIASRLEVRRWKDVPRFFVKSLAAWRQVRKAPGAYGASLIAQPLKRTFWTLSAWKDNDALYTYAGTEPHKGLMTGLRPVMKESTFITWESRTDELPVRWDEAHRRLAEHRGERPAGDSA